MKQLFYLIIFTFSGILQAQQWQDSFDDALTKAADEDKPIVLVFSGSDWCAPCIRLKRHIFDAEEFRTYAVEHYVMYDADFPRKKKNQLPQEKLNVNKSLAEKYNPKGYFPLVVVMDKNQNVLGTTGFVARTSPEKYIKTLNKFLK
ncbi:thioredoxin family protein [Flagellimonas lutimaris]|jgi:thioredoxin-related protein|uniref:Thioredoxin family protein n=1 Tax=Flagellimonas lutimaris TaxID=475082 RepID=A0A3A1NA97_9FLAO|nr:thioredoxin family protein [Allomuricauda lutimaris]RIV31420.1 thioredoxin family protein [Allomuricauda lutimaris]|tara:strand:+ start:288 stop:725 length:438 start_codon:yes stop_codon:yes gene_type:complete